jgi:hypothetical protein
MQTKLDHDLLNRVCVPCIQSVMTILDELG